MTFIEKCCAGKAGPEDVHDHVQAWHAGDGADAELYEYLGMTKQEYFDWVADHENLKGIVQNYKEGRHAE